MKTNPNDPLHPLTWTARTDGVPELTTLNSGLTKREYFAAMRRPQEGDSSLSAAVAEMIMGSKHPQIFSKESILWWVEAEEKLAVLHADALIKALNEPQTTTP